MTEFLPTTQETLGQLPALSKLDVVCTPVIPAQEVEAGRSEVQCQPQVHSEFQDTRDLLLKILVKTKTDLELKYLL